MMQKAEQIFAWCVLLANLVAACQWFIVTYQPFAVCPLVTVIAIEYLMRVGWVLSGLVLAIGMAAWVRVHSARPFAVAVLSLVPYGVILVAALAGIHPTA